MKLALLEKWHKAVCTFYSVSTPDRVGAIHCTNKTPFFEVGEGGYMKRPLVFTGAMI